jgi:anti-sigma factor RsiW
MRCPIESRDSGVLLAYVERRLEAETASTFERHIGSCPACQEAVAVQKRVSEALDRWEPAAIDAGFNRRLYARIEAGQQLSWWRRLWEPAPGGHALPLKSSETIDAELVETVLDDLDMLTQLGVAKL